MLVYFSRLSPLQRGIIAIIFGLILLLFALGAFQAVFGFIIILSSLAFILSGLIESGLYAKLVALVKKKK